jgi:aspartate carbamoyltransferase catalytic subunit
MREKRGSLDGLRVAIVGDITHSRVARSDIWGLKKFDTDICLVGPQTLIPAEIERLGVRVTHRLEEGLEGADVVVVLRLQLERMESGFLPTLREYALRFGLGKDQMQREPQLLVMHPGPINRGVEIDPDVADGPESVILEQVANGVAVRMAVCFLLWGNVRDEALAETADQGR